MNLMYVASFARSSSPNEICSKLFDASPSKHQVFRILEVGADPLVLTLKDISMLYKAFPPRQIDTIDLINVLGIKLRTCDSADHVDVDGTLANY